MTPKYAVHSLFFALMLFAGAFVAKEYYFQPPTLKELADPVDLGVVLGDAVNTVTLPITNVGGRDLKIGIDRVSCGCLSTKLESDTVAPNSTQMLVAKVSTFEKRDDFNVTIGLKTNDPSHRTYLLRLKGRIECPIEPAEKVINFGRILQSDLPLEKTVALEMGDPLLFKGKAPFFEPRDSRFYTRSTIDINGMRGELRVCLANDAPVGDLRTSVVITSPDFEGLAVSVPVLANISGRVKVEPSSLYFGTLKDSKQKSVSSRLIGLRPGEKVEIEEMRVLPESAQNAVQLHVTRSAPDVVLGATISAGKEFKNSTISGDILLCIEEDKPGSDKTRVLVPFFALCRVS